MQGWRKCCEVNGGVDGYNLNGNCPWRAWRLKGYAGICQREEMVKGGCEILNSAEAAVDRRLAVGQQSASRLLTHG